MAIVYCQLFYLRGTTIAVWYFVRSRDVWITLALSVRTVLYMYVVTLCKLVSQYPRTMTEPRTHDSVHVLGFPLIREEKK